MKVLSLFDGMAAGRLALERAGIPVESYTACEIDPHAIKVATHNWPDIREVGDITKFSAHPGEYDLVIGGSPCTNLSRYNKEDPSGLDGNSSGLFWHFLRLLRLIKPRWFLLENVRMVNKWKLMITSEVGVQPVVIDSQCLSAQHRYRLYWTNIPIPPLPSSDLVLRDVIESEPVDPKWYLSEKAKAYMERKLESREGKPWFGGKSRYESFSNPLDGKSLTVAASAYKGVPYGVVRERGRRLTCREAERLQTFPDDYSLVPGVSDSQRLKMLGNGWTVDVIAHIFRGLHA